MKIFVNIKEFTNFKRTYCLKGNSKKYFGYYNNKQWIIKKYNSKNNNDIIINEYISYLIYKKCKLPTSKYIIIKDNKDFYLGILFDKNYKFCENNNSICKNIKNIPSKYNFLLNGYIIDIWLCNWDVIGLEYDNIAIKNNKVYRIDLGGCLSFRATGVKRNINQKITEHKLILTNKLFSSYSIFRHLKKYNITYGINLLGKISDNSIKKILLYFNKYTSIDLNKLCNKVIKRKQYILNNKLDFYKYI